MGRPQPQPSPLGPLEREPEPSKGRGAGVEVNFLTGSHSPGAGSPTSDDSCLSHGPDGAKGSGEESGGAGEPWGDVEGAEEERRGALVCTLPL